MAIKESVVFPSRFSTSDLTGYPFGKAVDRTSPGNGSPFRADWFNDWLGFKSAVLKQGGDITPSGTPDKADASQILEGLTAILNKDASETIKGIAKIATQAIAEDKANDTDIMTSLKTQQQIIASFDQSLTQKGHCVLPNGYIFQHGREISITNGTSVITTFSTTFPNQCFGVYACSLIAGQVSNALNVESITNSGSSIKNSTNQNTSINWFAIGY
jgi:hypothetical protein